MGDTWLTPIVIHAIINYAYCLCITRLKEDVDVFMHQL